MPTRSSNAPDAIATAAPLTLVERVTLREEAPSSARPEPPSPTVKAAVCSPRHQSLLPGSEQLFAPGSSATTGAFLSTRIPAIGAAVAELPTASATDFESVAASSFSVPSGTLVVSWNVASAGFWRPEPPSAAVQPIATSTADHAEGADAHASAGAFRSTMNENRADALLPALSVRLSVFVATAADSAPSGSAVRSSKVGLLASPDGPASWAVHDRTTFSPCQPAGSAPQS